MPTPTPTQQAVLDLIHAFGLLTTSQIHQYLETPTTKHALLRLLDRLRDYGWLRSEPTDPTRHGRSEYYWTLTAAGATLLGVPAPTRSGTLGAQRILDLRPSVSPKGAAILRLLARWRQLTTGQVWQELHAEKPRRYTTSALLDLRRSGFIHGHPVDPTRGPAGEYYWFLREPGAYALDVTYDNHFRRRPTRDTLAFRGLQLDLLRQVRAAGWMVIPAERYSPAHPRPDTTPQYHHLVATVLTCERQAVAAALAGGTPPHLLEHRQALLRIGSTGAVVPPAVNDYVVYRPAAPTQAAVLIPHPPYATRSFWTRNPGPAQHHPARTGRHDSRIARYHRLAQVLPVIAVFPSDDLAVQYADVLRAAGLHAVAATEVGARLALLFAAS